MKTYYVKKSKGSRPVVGASVLEKKPKVGSYVNFNVGSDVKIECQTGGVLDTPGLTGGTAVAADSIFFYTETDFGNGIEYSYVDLYFSSPEYGVPHTIDQLLEMFNKRAGGMFHIVLENGKFYVTKNGFSTPLSPSYVYLGANYY
jgi:hypothetical protein